MSSESGVIICVHRIFLLLECPELSSAITYLYVSVPTSCFLSCHFSSVFDYQDTDVPIYEG